MFTPTLDANDSGPRTSLGNRHANLQTDGVSTQEPLHPETQVLTLVLPRPRVILVEQRGVLCGLVTVKDVLRYIATEKPGHRPSWDERGGLDGLLEEIWTWGSELKARIVSWGLRVLRR